MLILNNKVGYFCYSFDFDCYSRNPSLVQRENYGSHKSSDGDGDSKHL